MAVDEEKKNAKPTPTLRPSANKARVRVSNQLEPPKKKKEETKKEEIARRRRRLDVSTDSSSTSSDSSSKGAGFGVRRRGSGARPVKVAPEPVKGLLPAMLPLLPPALGKRRCTWITANSEEVYVSFHDEVWGFPVHDDRKLFELLIFSEALAELSWPAILNKRDAFRMLFADFEPSSVAEFTEKRIISLNSCNNSLLSEQKLCAVIENARQMLKVIEEFGSFSRYCWNFVNHKPLANGYRYPRQVPVKTPKAEAMSKDMMRRGFRCVGPTVIYSFMQAAGIVNDHLASCFRYQECMNLHAKETKGNAEDPAAISQALEKACSLQN
ncbi:uncharacterized protein M6B38_296945 [Iris pallida]|uniref:DNA-3-methyladenine glycosylase I n=1 Tax=Iris pallida TaxID=29817 RepID=A0AAX6HRM4_IRIPA|nr:uncharacterized protein M6B38_296945 [Iris pallida]